MAATKLASVSVSRGRKVSEWHDRRAHVPANAEATFADANAVIFDVGSFKKAVNDEMRSTIASYNDKRAAAGDAKRAEVEAFNADADQQNAAHADDEDWKPIKLKRFKAEKYEGKSYDYYSEVSHSDYKNDQQPVLEFVIQFGRRETHGVCDDPFDDEEYEAAQRLDEADGGTRAEEYERTHFDYDAWEDLKAKDPVAASAYAQAHRATGDKKARHDEAYQMAKELGEKVAAHPEKYLPKGAKLMMVALHDDEPGGTPHLHIAFAPFAEGYKRGLEKRISLSKCFHDAGYKGSDYMKQWQNEIKGEMCAVMRNHGYQREHMQNEEAHLAPSEMREKRRGERARRHAEKIEAELRERSDELARVEDDLEAAKTDLTFARMGAGAVREDAAAAEREQARAEAEARRAVALADVREHGYAPPDYSDVHLLREGVDYDYTDELRAIDEWFSLSGDVDLDGLDVPAPTRRAMRAGDEDALHERYEAAMAEQLTERFGPGELLNVGPVTFWVDADEGGGLLDDEGRQDLEDSLWEEVAPAVAAGLDPTEPYAGLEEREDEVSEREAAADEREQRLDEREGDVERREGAVAAHEREVGRRLTAVLLREQKVEGRENAATEREQAVAARERKADAAETANERRAADLTAAANALSEAKDQLGDVPQVEGRDADEFADDVVMTFAHELAESGIPKFVECADTMRRQWQFGHQQRVVDGAGFVSDRTLREIVLDTVRRGGEAVQRIKDGLKATIDRALGALGRHETAEQKARRMQRTAVQARDVAQATPTARDDFAFRGLSDLERPASGPSTGAQRPREHGEMGL